MIFAKGMLPITAMVTGFSLVASRRENYLSKFNTGRDFLHDGRWGNAPTINGKFRPELIAAPGERIGIPLINGAKARIFSPTFNIAVDCRPVPNTFSLTWFPLTHCHYVLWRWDNLHTKLTT